MTFDEELAGSMDAGPDLFPYLPELFQDLEDLGIRSQDVLAILEAQDLPPHARVLDLGCGKGAALLALAQERGIDGIGVDGIEAFSDHGNERARALGLEERVRFISEDLQEVLNEARGAELDLVMLLAMGPVLGDLSESVGILRACVRPGGMILIDDAYLAPGASQSGIDEEGLLSYEETLAALTSHGDERIGERAYEDEAYGAWCREMTDKIMERAESMSRRSPEAARALLGFARRQQEETASLGEGELVGALFLLRRAEDAPG